MSCRALPSALGSQSRSRIIRFQEQLMKPLFLFLIVATCVAISCLAQSFVHRDAVSKMEGELDDSKRQVSDIETVAKAPDRNYWGSHRRASREHPRARGDKDGK